MEKKINREKEILEIKEKTVSKNKDRYNFYRLRFKRKNDYY